MIIYEKCLYFCYRKIIIYDRVLVFIYFFWNIKTRKIVPTLFHKCPIVGITHDHVFTDALRHSPAARGAMHPSE